MPLYTVIVSLGNERWRVRSALATRPIAGDRIRYGELLELDVVRVVLDVGTGGGVDVITAPTLELGTLIDRPTLEGRLEALRFRREAQDSEATAATP